MQNFSHTPPRSHLGAQLESIWSFVQGASRGHWPVPHFPGGERAPSVREGECGHFWTGCALADSVHHILPSGLRLRQESGPRQREREGGKGEAGLEEVQTKFGSFMIYDRQTGESRITFPGPLSASCLIFPRALTSPGLILPDAGHLSRLPSPSSCQSRVSSFTWFSPSTAQVGVSSVTPSQHQRPSQILSGLYFHILVSPFPSWEWWEYRNQKLI